MSRIAVVGDVTIDLLKKIEKKTVQITKNYEKDNWELYFGHAQKLRGGALLLSEMIEESWRGNVNSYEIIKYNEKYIEKNYKDFLHTIITLGEYKHLIEEENCEENDKINRINYFDGFNFPKESDDSKKRNKTKLSIKNNEVEKEFNDLKNVNMVIIHDHGNYFREIDNYNKYFHGIHLSQACDKNKCEPLFIHKMRFPLAEGNLWNNFIKTKEKLIVIISADDLRENGLRISRSLSWERTAFDLRKSVEKILEDPNDENKALVELFEKKNLNLIIRFETDGAVLYQNMKDKIQFTLFFDPDIFEGTNDQKYPGNMKSLGIAFVSGLVLGIEKFPKDLDLGIKDGIKKGIVVSRKLYEYGFKPDIDGKMNYPYNYMFSDIEYETKSIHDVNIGERINWEIIDQTLKDKEDIYNVACQIVKSGKSPKLTAPIAKFGKLHTADRSEIESYNSVKNLINEYLTKKNVKKPLSIAVFGPPGAGKSFGVTEIAKSISNDIKKLEFNLSQFQSPNDLFSAFHMIQSTALGGKTPLVFFDEFDSTLNDVSFGWLKYFLSPMNDGTFKQGDMIHPIGKCIFVFAGSVKKTFEELEVDKDKSKVKGSDFISRLRGFVNIVGINKSNGYEYFEIFNPIQWQITNYDSINTKIFNNINWKNDDNSYMIRRAMVLRSLLEKNAENIFEEHNGRKIAQIDKSVLNALIEVPNYKHENRSMEAIIEMSTLSNKKRFDRSALPSSELLELHVNADKFKKYLNNPRDCKEENEPTKSHLLVSKNIMFDPSSLMSINELAEIRDFIDKNFKEFQFYIPSTFQKLIKSGNIQPIISEFYENGTFHKEHLLDLLENQEERINLIGFPETTKEYQHFKLKYGSFYENLSKKVDDSVLRDIIFEEWVFLQEKSWIVSKSKKVFKKFKESGTTTLEFSETTIGAVTRKTLNKKTNEAITTINKLSVIGNYIAIGCFTTAALLRNEIAPSCGLSNAIIGLYY